MSEPTTRYFQVQGATKPVAGIQFQPFDIIGSILWGIYATQDPAEIEAITKEMNENPRRGVSELSAEDYFGMAQKKTPSFVNSRSFNPHPVVSQPKQAPPSPSPTPAPILSPIKGSGAVVDPNPPPAPTEPEVVVTAAPVANVAEAIQTGDVTPSPTNPPKPSKKAVTAK